MTRKRFDREAYRDMLCEIKKKRPHFLSFLEPEAEKSIRIRIDIDCDVGWAAEIAQVLSRENIAATFFPLLSSPLYNLFSLPSRQALETITNSGHWIGLHFHNSSPELDIERLRQEFHLLQFLVPRAQKVVAWHNPEGGLVRINRAAKEEGFCSTYDEEFFSVDRYISDSNLAVSPEEIIEFVTKSTHPTLQALFHPVNWVLTGNTMEEVLVRTVSRKLDQMFDVLSDNRVWIKGLGKLVRDEMLRCRWYAKYQK